MKTSSNTDAPSSKKVLRELERRFRLHSTSYSISMAGWLVLARAYIPRRVSCTCVGVGGEGPEQTAKARRASSDVREMVLAPAQDHRRPPPGTFVAAAAASLARFCLSALLRPPPLASLSASQASHARTSQPPRPPPRRRRPSPPREPPRASRVTSSGSVLPIHQKQVRFRALFRALRAVGAVAVGAVAVGVARGLLVPPALVVLVILVVLVVLARAARGPLASRDDLRRCAAPVVGAAAVGRRAAGAAALAAGPAAGLAVVVVLGGRGGTGGGVSARVKNQKLSTPIQAKGMASRGDKILRVDAGVGGARSHRVGAGIRGAVAGIHVSPLVLRWGRRRGSVGVAARSPAGARCRGDRAPPRLRAGGCRRWERDGSRRWRAGSP